MIIHVVDLRSSGDSRVKRGVRSRKLPELVNVPVISCDMNVYMWNMQITYNYMSTIPNITIYDRMIWNSLQSCTLPKTLLMLWSDSPHWYRGYLHQMLWNQYILSPSGNFWQKKWQTSQKWWKMHRKCQLFRYLNIHFECTNMWPIWPSMQTSCRRVEEVLVG